MGTRQGDPSEGIGMVTFEELAGQSSYLESLRAEFAQRRFVNAYLLIGPKGVGKKTAAQLCAMAAVCRGEKKPCGECGPCRRVLSGTHPDVHTIVPEAKKKSIGVDPMREALEEVGISSFEDGAKVMLIPEAERMTVQTQNVLLKTLEEPPENTVFLLITEQPGALLPTIISRCRTVRFHPLPFEEAEKRLIDLGRTKAQAAQAARISGGCIGQALEMDAGQSELLHRVTENAFSCRKPSDVPTKTDSYKDDKTAQRQVLDILDAAVRNILLAQAGGPALPDGLYAPEAESYAAAVPTAGGLRLADAIIEARKRVDSNVSFSAAYERILFELTEEYKIWPW